MKKVLIIVLCAALLVGLCSCTQKADTDAKTSLNMSFSNELGSLDPFYTASAMDLYACYFIYDGLFNIRADNSYEPLVAEKWTISDDGLLYTFTIRQGIKFHNGTDLDAADVAYSFDRAKESPYMDFLTSAIDHVETQGNDVLVYLTQPNASFLATLVATFVVYEDEYTKAADADESMGNKPMGCGAYALESFSGTDGVVLKAFDDYYLGAAPIKDVSLRVIPDASTALISLENKEIDYINYAPSASIAGLKERDDIKVSVFPYYKIISAILNTKVEPLGDQRVRQAINYAVDRQYMIDVCDEGFGTPATSLINETIFGWSENIKGYEHDVDKAKQLLAEAGYPNGEGFPVLNIDCIESYKNHATAMQASLKEIGIETKINMLELNAMMNKAMNGENEIVLFAIEFGRDASFYENMVGDGAVFNWSQHAIPGVDELFKQGLNTLDQDGRVSIYTDIMNRVNEDGAFVALYFPQIVVTCTNGLYVDDYWTYVQPKGKDLRWE